jgi:hypothetical protein
MTPGHETGDETVDVRILQKQFSDLKKEQADKRSKNDGNDVPPHIPPMSDDSRIGRLEGEVGGLKHGQTQLLVAVGVVAAFVIGFGFYNLQRIDQVNDRVDRLSDKINELPGKISSELRDITKTLAESITAAKQQPPQVILIPTPQQPPNPPKP